MYLLYFLNSCYFKNGPLFYLQCCLDFVQIFMPSSTVKILLDTKKVNLLKESFLPPKSFLKYSSLFSRLSFLARVVFYSWPHQTEGIVLISMHFFKPFKAFLPVNSGMLCKFKYVNKMFSNYTVEWMITAHKPVL